MHWIVLSGLFFGHVSVVFAFLQSLERPLPVWLTFQRSYRGTLASQWTELQLLEGPEPLQFFNSKSQENILRWLVLSAESSSGGSSQGSNLLHFLFSMSIQY